MSRGGALGAEAPRTRGPRKKKEEEKKKKKEKERKKEKEKEKERKEANDNEKYLSPSLPPLILGGGVWGVGVSFSPSKI